MIRAAALLLALLPFGVPAGAQDSPADVAAKAAFKKLSEKFKDLRTLSAKVVQTRRTELMDKPLLSSGTMYYRREPAQMVIQLAEPGKAEIHMDRKSYQVYRPAEKRLEVTEFTGEGVSGKILMAFEPKADDVGKTFSIHGGDSRDGKIEVRLESSDEKVQKRLRRISLTIAEADGALHRIVYVDAQGDETQFDLSDVALNPELAPSVFKLNIPEGTRVLRSTLPADK